MCLSAVGFVDYLTNVPAGSDLADNVHIQPELLADLDSDGDQDLIIGGFNRIVWYQNTNGEFLYDQQIVRNGFQGVPYFDGFLAAADMDGDADLDVIATEASPHYGANHVVAWYENLDGQGTFGGRQIAVPEIPFDIVSFDVADLDGDGDVDIVSTSTQDDMASLGWYENVDGKFGDRQDIVVPRIEDGRLLMYLKCGPIVDLDGDGDLDLTASYKTILHPNRPSDENTSRYQSAIVWVENIGGDGQFAEPRLLNDTVEADLLAAADFDDDGDVDLVAAKTYSRFGLAKFVRLDNVDGTFSDPVVLDQRGERARIPWFYFHGMQVGDIDGDGDTDIVLYSTPNGSYRGTVYEWFENDGAGSFPSANRIANATGNFLLSDVDGDGDLDIQTSFYYQTGENTYTPRIRWLKNVGVPGDANGDGRFDSSDLVQIFQAGHYEDAVDRNSTKAEGDFNGDGDFTTADLVFAFQHENYLAAIRFETAIELTVSPEKRLTSDRSGVPIRLADNDDRVNNTGFFNPQH
ncbi:MAG: FG-GAP-like repeat-containing protein [Pirellulaceae bacterium]